MSPHLGGEGGGGGGGVDVRFSSTRVCNVILLFFFK